MILNKHVDISAINTEINKINLGITDETLITLKEFLTAIESGSTITVDIAKKGGYSLNELAYQTYVDLYDNYKNKVAPQDLEMYSKLTNYICMSSFGAAKITDLKIFSGNYYINDSNQFLTPESSIFNVPVGVEYKLYYKTFVYNGVYSAEKTPHNLSTAYLKLFSSENMNKISDGVIKVNRFKDGSYIRLHFMINSESFDEFKSHIFKIINEDLFTKWEFKDICTPEEIIKIRYIYKIKSEINCSPKQSEDIFSSMDEVTHTCMCWVLKTMYSSAAAERNYNSALLFNVRDFVIPICLHYFIPEKDRELFYKLLNYLTYKSDNCAIIGFNGLSETNPEEATKILENFGKMERLIEKIVHGKNVSKKNVHLKLNLGYISFFLCAIDNPKDLDKFIHHIVNSDIYKQWNIEEADNDSNYINNFTIQGPFESIGLSEETVFLAIMAINSLYAIDNAPKRDEVRETLLKRSARFVKKTEYELFSDIVTKFTFEDNGVFKHVPSEFMSIDAHFMKSRSSYYNQDDFIQKTSFYQGIKVDIDNSFGGHVIYPQTNNRISAFESVQELFSQGKVSSAYGNVSIFKPEDCFVAFIPSIEVFEKVDYGKIKLTNPFIMSEKIKNLLSIVLEIKQDSATSQSTHIINVVSTKSQEPAIQEVTVITENNVSAVAPDEAINTSEQTLNIKTETNTNPVDFSLNFKWINVTQGKVKAF